ncbi:4366_t:CDS:10 [Funneliformis geosporum]|uniref:DNA damage-binding protein 1 n=1 Tax=Funneliformis geosporum TaxID=1117311 RepID=A0A9W4SJE8_9GLOM|nr:4366_t:CDS:10 [Funneliformis geosporum]
MYNYVVTAHKPSTVVSSVRASFSAPDETNLILNKTTRLEFYTLVPNGLKLFMDLPVYARISAMEGRTTDLLFVATARYQYFVLSYDVENQKLITEATGNFVNRVGKPAELGPLSAIDPNCKMIGLYAYHGLLTVMPMITSSGKQKQQLNKSTQQIRREARNNQPIGTIQKPFNLRLKELLIRSMVLLHNTDLPTIAILHEDSKERCHIKTYTINLKEKEFVDGPWKLNDIDDTSNLLVSVPKGGILIVQSKTIVYYDGNFKARQIDLEFPTAARGIAAVDDDGSRYLIGDVFGQLILIVLPDTGELYSHFLGKISVPSSLLYLDHSYVFVGSHFGDSQLIRLRQDKNEQGFLLDILEKFINLSPIQDFCIVNLERQGQGQVITCSGGSRDGSLRIIRNGVGITVQATMDMSGINGIWSLRPNFDADYDDMMVISFIGETRILKLSQGEELEEVNQYCGFDMSRPTIATSNIVGNLLAQVTETSVRLIDLNNQRVTSEWNPPALSKITVADINPTQVVVALGGGSLIYFEIRGLDLVEIKSTKLEYEVSCVNISPLDINNPINSTVVAVGLWTIIGVQILRLPTLEIIANQPLEGTAITRSVLLTTFEYNHYLIAALGDGQLFHFIFTPETGRLSEKKQLSLGTQPIMLTSFTSNGMNHVFAASDRPTVIYSSNKKLLYSNVNTKDVTYMCPFRPTSMATSLVITHEEGLTIGSIDEIQKLHIRTIPLNEMPRRIFHQECSNTIGILTTRPVPDPETGIQEHLSFFKVLDDQSFEFHCLTSVKFDHEREEAPEYYVVGTSFAFPNETEPFRGRILVFHVDKVDHAPKLKLAHEKEMRGAVFACAPFNGKLLVEGKGKLTEVCNYVNFTMALHVVARGHFVVVGDLLRSVTLLAYKELENGEKVLELIANDYNQNWLSAVEALDDDEFIAADTDHNLFTLKRNSDSTDEEERRKLEEVGAFHLGDLINRIRHGSLAMNNPDFEPIASKTLLFGTVSGAIGVIATISEDRFKFLQKLEHCIDKTVGPIGGLTHSDWRIFQNEYRSREVRDFVDGDLIESFLDLPRKDMAEIAITLGKKVDDLLKTVEEYTRMH